MAQANRSERFDRTLDALGPVLDWVDQFTVAERLSDGISQNLMLVVEELFTNQVRHQQGSELPIELSLARSNGTEIEFVLTDPEATFFDPENAPRPALDVPIEERPYGGLGVHFVKTLASLFEYRFDDGVAVTTVRLRIDD